MDRSGGHRVDQLLPPLHTMKALTLRRFPARSMEWERPAIPQSWLPKAEGGLVVFMKPAVKSSGALEGNAQPRAGSNTGKLWCRYPELADQ